MSDPTACIECYRRSWLLALLAPYIEQLLIREPGVPSPGLLALGEEDLARRAAPGLADQILTRLAAMGEEQMASELNAASAWACCRHRPGFPAHLQGTEELPMPPALVGVGDPGLLADLRPARAVAVVGARRATSYGREIARELGRELVRAGLLVLSGLDVGVDVCAHRGALDAGGRTVAVLGCGPDIAYPAANRSLWRRICEHGLVLSELPPGATPWRWTSPARNRIIAGLAGMTVVVEAAPRSGSLITAGCAGELGREVGAVPGPLTSPASAGSNALLADGACVIRDALDVLDALGVD